MNPGGEPERDDTGLPPVDIEIPDDARELDRDVQAYYREQRAQRRQQRRSRLHGFLAKDGIVLPLLACCLILALITGTLLTVFTAASDQGFSSLSGTGGQPGSASKASTGPASTGHSSAGASTGAGARASAIPGAGQSAARTASQAHQIVLPATTVQVSGRPVALHSLSRAMLVLVPRNCACAAAVVYLARFAARVHVKAYLISSAGQLSNVSHLADQVNGQPAARIPAARITVAIDSADVLAQHQHGLTAILIGPNHVAAVAGNLAARENLASLRHALAG